VILAGLGEDPVSWTNDLDKPAATLAEDDPLRHVDRLYEHASAAAICDYYSRVLDETLVPTGRVRFLGMSEYRGQSGGGHRVVSLLDGRETVVQPRRTVVDARYVESQPMSNPD
jgi:hypothetical protein